jgi:hypothetical protein
MSKLSDEQFYFMLSAALLSVVFALYAFSILEGMPS